MDEVMQLLTDLYPEKDIHVDMSVIMREFTVTVGNRSITIPIHGWESYLNQAIRVGVFEDNYGIRTSTKQKSDRATVKDAREWWVIDFDDTLRDWKTGEVIPGAKEALESYRSAGEYITIFTNRIDQKYTEVKTWLEENQIPFDRIICGKPFYTRMIDDKARHFQGWDKDYRI